MRSTHLASHITYLFGDVLVTLVVLLSAMPRATAIPQVANRFDQISDSAVSAQAIHRFGFEYTDLASPVGSVSLEFCSNSPISEEPCVAPSGLDVSGATLAAQSGETGFSISAPNTTANRLVLTRSAQAPSPATATSTYQFNNVTNPDALGTYYARIQTYTSANATGAALEDGGVVFIITATFDVSAEVPPYIKFCSSVTITGYDCDTATSFFIDFGEFSVTKPKFASSEMVLATNAGLGYSITLTGTTLTSGNNTIPAMAAVAPSNPGLSQFGLNLRANSSPNIGVDPNGPGLATPAASYNNPNFFKYEPGEVVVSGTTTTDSRKFTVSYIANISSSQAAGVYSTTISFIALANF
jgi:hypothetical protein